MCVCMIFLGLGKMEILGAEEFLWDHSNHVGKGRIDPYSLKFMGQQYQHNVGAARNANSQALS